MKSYLLLLLCLFSGLSEPAISYAASSRLPVILVPEQAFRATSALFDAEIVCLDRAGKPVFKDAIHRMQQTAPSAINRAQAAFPVVCYVFDCLFLDGRPIVEEPLERRRVWAAWT